MSSRRGVIVAAVCAVFLLAGSADARFIPGLNRVAADKGEVYRQGCLMGRDRVHSGACRFGDRRSSEKVVLFGDSHAMQWGPGLIRLAESRNWQVIALTRASCPAALVHIDFYCDTWRRNSLERIRKMRPGMVLVASAANDDAYEVSDGGVTLSRASSEDRLVDGMVRLLRRMKRWSGKAMVMQDQAVTPFNVTPCLRANVSRPSNCGFVPSRPREYSYDREGARLVPGVRLIDPMPMLCRGGWCHAVDHDYLVYRNQGHLSASFTRSKYQWLGHKIGHPFGKK